jgi:hypothetical protein
MVRLLPNVSDQTNLPNYLTTLLPNINIANLLTNFLKNNNLYIPNTSLPTNLFIFQSVDICINQLVHTDQIQEDHHSPFNDKYTIISELKNINKKN